MKSNIAIEEQDTILEILSNVDSSITSPSNYGGYGEHFRYAFTPIFF